MSVFKIFPEKKYKEIVESIGRFKYFLYEKAEILPGGFFSQISRLSDYTCVLAGTGATTGTCTLRLLGTEEIIIPKNEQVIVFRLLRYDDSHGEPHFNANDQIIFPTQKGNILRLARKDVPDHYIKISAESNMRTIAEAYKLPEEKSGPIEQYVESGARLHVDLQDG